RDADGGAVPQGGLDSGRNVDQVGVVETRHGGGPSAHTRVGNEVCAVAHLAVFLRDGSADILAGAAGGADAFLILEVKLAALLGLLVLVDVGDDGRAAVDEENVGAEVEDLFGDVAIEAVDDADDGDDGGDADDHAEERQDAAHLVRPEAGGGDAHGLAERHSRFSGHVWQLTPFYHTRQMGP